MKIKIKINIPFTSVSAVSQDSVVAFISTVLVLLSKLSGRDTKQFSADLSQWSTQAAPFTTQFGLRKTLTKAINSYKATDDIPVEFAIELGRAMKLKREAIERDTSITRPQVVLLKDIDNQLRTDSDAAWRRITKDVRILNNPKLNAAFPFEHKEDFDPKAYRSEIRKTAQALKLMVKKITGHDRPFLTLQEGIDLSKAKPAQAVEYRALTKIVGAAIKTEMFNFVRASGKQMVVVDDLKADLDKKGIPNNLPTGFTGGQVDDMGKFYTAEGRPIDTTPMGVVEMNPLYDPSLDNTYVMKGVDHKRLYRTTTFTAGNKDKRFSQVQAFIDGEDQTRKKWIAGLDAPGRAPILAAIVELLYATASRIGGVHNASAGQPTYGMTTLQVRHLSVTSTMISYDYTGKKLAQQGAHYPVRDVVSRRVRDILLALIKGKQPAEKVFTYKGKPVMDQAVRLYIKRNLGITLSPHDFRRIVGTKLATKVLKTSTFKAKDHPKQAAVEKWFAEAMKQVGEVLHHHSGEEVTSSTAIKAYIDPALIKSFFTSLGLRVPAKFVK